MRPSRASSDEVSLAAVKRAHKVSLAAADKVPLHVVEAAWRALSPYQRAVGWAESNALDDADVTYESALREALTWAITTKATRVPSASYMRRAQAAEGWQRTVSLAPTTLEYQAGVAEELAKLKKSSASGR